MADDGMANIVTTTPAPVGPIVYNDDFAVNPQAWSALPLNPFYHWPIDFYNSSYNFVTNDLVGWHYPTFMIFSVYCVIWVLLAIYLFTMAFHYKFMQSMRMRETAQPYKRRFQATTNELGVKHSVGLSH